MIAVRLPLYQIAALKILADEGSESVDWPEESVGFP
jgi:hypothetical protein